MQTITVKKFCKLFGLSQNTVFGWCYSGKLPSIKSNGSRLIDLSGLQNSQRRDQLFEILTKLSDAENVIEKLLLSEVKLNVIIKQGEASYEQS